MSVAHSTEQPASLFRNRNFWLLWAAFAVSAFGDHLSEMALLKTLNALDPQVDITRATARMTFVFFVPFFLLAPLTGYLADRLPRRTIMITADLTRAIIMLFFASLLAFFSNWGSWSTFLPLLPIGMFAALFGPARNAMLPTIVSSDQLIRANGLLSGIGIISTMAAVGVGGVLADHFEPIVSFRANSATFVLSAIFLFAMVLPRRAVPAEASQDAALRRAAPQGSVIQELTAGFRYVRTHYRVQQLIVIGAIVWFCGPLVNSAIPAIVRDEYGFRSYSNITLYRIFLGLGFVFGAVFMTFVGKALRGEIAITWGLFAIGISMLMLASSIFIPFSPTTASWIGAVAITMGGFGGVMTMAAYNARLQRIVPNRSLGRVYGVADLLGNGSILLATGTLGVSERIRLDAWVGELILLVAAITLTASLCTWIARKRRSTMHPIVSSAVNLNEFYAKYWFRMERVGPSTLPRTGAIIITANHRCSADSLCLMAASPYRTMSFMVAAEYANMPGIRSLLSLNECIPVTRSGQDTAAIKQALRNLHAGKVMAIFLEGRLVPPGEVSEPRDGVAMLALRTNTPVLPVYIAGTKYYYSVLWGLISGKHRARVYMGKPMDLSELATWPDRRAAQREATRRICEAISQLMPHGDNSFQYKVNTDDAG